SAHHPAARAASSALSLHDALPLSGYFVGILNLCHPANIQPHRCVKFQGITSGGGFGIAKHDAYFFAQLVDENTATVGFGNCARKDRKSTRLNSSHVKISYAVFCLK